MRTLAAACVGLAVFSTLAAVASAQDLYCGDNNCYDGKLLLLVASEPTLPLVTFVAFISYM